MIIQSLVLVDFYRCLMAKMLLTLLCIALLVVAFGYDGQYEGHYRSFHGHVLILNDMIIEAITGFKRENL